MWCNGREVPAGQPRQLAVLGVLATRANHVVSRSELVDAVWGDQPPASAEGGVYTYVAGLRRVIEPERPLRSPERSRRTPARVLVSVGGGYMLRLGPGALDAADFGQSLSRAHELRADGDLAGAAAAVEEALALWRGTAFAGVPGPFAEAERQRLGELRTAAAEEHADLVLALGRPAGAVPELTALAAEHPLRERTRGLLMIALYRCGRQADALQVFYDVRERLAEELGIDPGSELAHIHQQVLAMDPALDGPTEQAAAVLAVPPPAAPSQGPLSQPEPALRTVRTPAQVPPEIASFAGRAAELRDLDAMIPAEADATPGPGAPPAVAVVTGTAGVGKTALAIRFARQAAARFADGQLYVNLRGFDPSGSPLDPATALRGFLDALGVPPRQVPAPLEGKTGLFRSLLEGKRMLLLLDNARSTDQVRPLLPGGPGCMVVITSRSQLTGLVAAEGARLLPLSLLSGTEARELLAGRLGEDRVAAEPAAAGELILRSSGLPIALSVTCARAASRPALALVDLATELRDAHGRLDALRTDDASTDLRTVFSWSYDRLSAAAARMFRLLGVHPGPDLSAAAAASLAGIPLPAARAALAELTRASLLTEDTTDRFTCHDLLRAYAAERAATADSEEERDQARVRLLDHYLRTAIAGTLVLFPAGYRVAAVAAVPGVTPGEFGSFADVLAWFGAEHQVLHAQVDFAAERGHDEYCWQLALHWVRVLKRRSLFDEVVTVLGTGLAAARRLGDPVGLGHMHYQLGWIYAKLGKPAEATAHLDRALQTFTELGDHVNMAEVRHGFVLLLEGQGRFAEALPHAREALRLRRSFADRAVIAYSENTVGWLHANLGEYQEALRNCKRSLELHREAGNLIGAADTLDSIGYAYAGLGDYEQAIAHYRQALDMYGDVGDADSESSVLVHLGDAQLAAGYPAAARRSWEQALTLLARVPGKDGQAVRTRLAQLAGGEAASA